MMRLNRYDGGRGGHAPGHLREAFERYVENGAVGDCTDDDSIGLLWNCTDIMPSDLCAALEQPQGSTYARGARWARLHEVLRLRKDTVA